HQDHFVDDIIFVRTTAASSGLPRKSPEVLVFQHQKTQERERDAEWPMQALAQGFAPFSRVSASRRKSWNISRRFHRCPEPVDTSDLASWAVSIQWSAFSSHFRASSACPRRW